MELAPNKPHDHLIDIRSGKVIEFRSDKIERLLTELQIASAIGSSSTGSCSMEFRSMGTNRVRFESLTDTKLIIELFCLADQKLHEIGW